jgi:serine/threonine protein kinase
MRDAGVNEGDLLFGKYRVERVVGSGGMGVVVAARHEQLDQLVAIKFISENALGHTDAAQRFLQEARAAAKLKSEHVIRVLDVGMLESGAPYMIMEFLEGSDLEKVVAQFGPMPPTYALRLFRQACAGLAEAHAAGIVHRDLKPQNLFLTHTPDGSPRLKVLDFGISKTPETVGSKARHALTGATAVLGSPLYMAPEQMQSSRDVDARADVWSLGVVLFELLTGRCPFEADTYAALCMKISTGAPNRLSDLRDDVPAEVAAIIERCLERDVTKRFANAAEVAEALDALPPEILPPSDTHGRPAWSTSATGAPGTLRKSEITPPGWASHGDGKAPGSRRAVSGLLVAGVMLVAGFAVVRWRGATGHATSSVQVAPAASSTPELHAASAEVLTPPMSEVATGGAPPVTVLTPAVQNPPPAWRAPMSAPATTPAVGPLRTVGGNGVPVRRAPWSRWNPSAAGPKTAPSVAPAAANLAADEGIPSRR